MKETDNLEQNLVFLEVYVDKFVATIVRSLDLYPKYAVRHPGGTCTGTAQQHTTHTTRRTVTHTLERPLIMSFSQFPEARMPPAGGGAGHALRGGATLCVSGLLLSALHLSRHHRSRRIRLVGGGGCVTLAQYLTRTTHAYSPQRCRACLRLWAEVVSPTVRRNLVIVSKVLQNIANNAQFSNKKEGFMAPLNPLVLSHQPVIQSFLNAMAQPVRHNTHSTDIHAPNDTTIHYHAYTRLTVCAGRGGSGGAGAERGAAPRPAGRELPAAATAPQPAAGAGPARVGRGGDEGGRDGRAPRRTRTAAAAAGAATGEGGASGRHRHARPRCGEWDLARPARAALAAQV